MSAAQNKALAAEGEIEAVVIKVVSGKKGRPYVVTYIGTDPVPVTFEMSAWLDERAPENGQVVVLTGVRKFREGWRAVSARPVLYTKK